MTWDFATGQDYVQIEEVSGNDVIRCIASIPLDTPHAEAIAESICNAHNADRMAELLRDIIASSDANDGDSLANAINAAREELDPDFARQNDPVEIEKSLRD